MLENSALKKVPILLVGTFKDIRDKYISTFPQNFPPNYTFQETKPPSDSINNNNKSSNSVWTSMQKMQKNLEHIKPRKNTQICNMVATPSVMLNSDIMNIVFSYLDIQSLARSEQVCKKWRESIFTMHKGNIFELFRCPCIPTIYVCPTSHSTHRIRLNT